MVRNVPPAGLRSPEWLCERPRLLAAMDRAARHPVVVVAAPAGYGKSTRLPVTGSDAVLLALVGLAAIGLGTWASVRSRRMNRLLMASARHLVDS